MRNIGCSQEKVVVMMKKQVIESKGGKLIRLNHKRIVVAVEQANKCLAKELVALFTISEELGFSKGFKFVGGTARDFVFGIVLGIDVIERSSDFDVIIPGVQDQLVADFALCDKISDMVAERCRSNRKTFVDIALGCPVGDEGQLAYEEVYKTADLSIARMVIEQQGDFYVISDEYGGIEDTAERILRLVKLDLDMPQDVTPEIGGRIFMRYIPYWTKLIPYDFDYESRTQSYIDNFLRRREFDLQDVLNGIIMTLEKAHDNIAVARTLERFALIDLLKEKLEELKLSLDSVQVKQLKRLAGLLERLLEKKVLTRKEMAEIDSTLDEPID